MTDKTKLAAAYIPFRTFFTALDYLHDHGVPNVIDKTVFPKVATVVQGQLITALRFLGLIDENGIPSQELKDLASNTDNRAQTLRPVLEVAYADLFAGKLDGMTPSQFDSLFTAEAYNVSGDTLKKAKAFFLKAAEFAKVQLSSHLTRRSRASGPRKKRQPKAAGAGGAGATGDTLTPQITPPPGASIKTLIFPSGGSISLTLNVNILELRGKERAFVFDLIDKIEAYEGPGEPSPGEEVSE